MEVRHEDADLESAERDPEYRGALDHKRVRALIKVLTTVRGVSNEGALRNHKGLNFKPLKGNRSHQHSMKLNDQFRVIVEIEKRPGPNNNLCVVKEITDIHDD